MLANSILSFTLNKFIDQRAIIKSKIQGLEAKKVSLSKSLEHEFDKQVQAELAGEIYDESNIKSINSELIQIEGRIDAYRRQLQIDKLLTTQDKEDLIAEAAKEYRKIIIKNLEQIIKRYEMDIQIRKLMSEAKQINNFESNVVFEELKKSGLFNEIDIHSLQDDVEARVNIKSDAEYIELSEKVNEYKKNKTSAFSFIWNK